MVRDFRRDDEGKMVMTAKGDMVGKIEQVESGRAHIKPHESLGRGTRRKLGWSGERETYELRKANVDEITGEEVHLKEDI